MVTIVKYSESRLLFSYLTNLFYLEGIFPVLVFLYISGQFIMMEDTISRKVDERIAQYEQKLNADKLQDGIYL